jgi:hypothetical protein
MSAKRRYLSSSILPLVAALPPIRGTWYFIDGTAGSDANDGLSPESALKTLYATTTTTGDTGAYAKLVSSRGDGICILSTATTATSYSATISASFTWSKSGVTVVGLDSGSLYNHRARITFASAVTGYYLFNITGHNNCFKNLSFYNGSDLSDAQITTVKMVNTTAGTVSRNNFERCHFLCTPATASAYKCDLWMENAHENTFTKCVFGNASYDAGNNAACHIYIAGAANTGNAQNIFCECYGIAQVSTGTAFGGLKSGSATSLNGLMIFDRCIFGVWQANTGMPAMASWFIGTKPTTGWIQQPAIIGYAAGDSVAANDCIISTEPDSAAGGQIGIATA